MIQNIPCRSIPMPYYTIPPSGPNYENMPLTFAPISSNTSIKLTSNSGTNKKFYYNKTSNGSQTGWTQYTFGTTISLNVGDSIAFSGDSTPFHGTSLDQTNPFVFTGSSNGQLMAYGNIHSLIAYSTLTDRCFRNLFRGQQNISDYSKIWLPLPSGYSISGIYGSAWRADQYVKKLPIFRMIDFTYLADQTLNATGYRSQNLSCVEVSWTSWPSTSNITYFMYNTNSNSSSIYIKPSNLPLQRASSNNGKIPNGWTVLNRNTTSGPDYGKLTYAETANGHTAGEQYTGEDPYAWYYNR